MNPRDGMPVSTASRGRGGPHRAGSPRRARRRDLRLVPAAVTAWVVAAIAVQSAEQAAVGAVLLWIGVGVSVMAAVRGRPAVRTVGALAAVALAAGAAVATHVATAQPGRARAAALPLDGGRSATFDLVAVGKIERTGDGVRFDALLARAQIGPRVERSTGAGVPVRVRVAEAPPGLDLGSRVRATGTAWLPGSGERAVLVIDAGDAVRVLSAPEGPFAVASALRRGLLAQTAGLPPPAGGLIAGLAVGDTSAVAPSLDEAMKASSLSHLTAVSGANCALVVALAFGAAVLCRAPRGVRVLVGLSALGAFVVLVSPEPSVVRAAAMAAIAMLGVLLGRPGAGVALLTSAVTVLLIVDPWLALSLGFSLSVAATGALLLVAGPLADGLARWVPAPLALAIAVPLAAQLACGPLIVLISPQLSVYGVVANLLASPAAPVGTVLGLAACLTAGVPALGAGLAAVAWLPAAWIAGVAHTTTALPGSVVDWPEGIPGLAALALLGVAVAVVVLRVGPRLRAAGILLLAAGAGTWLATGPVSDLQRRVSVPHEWDVAACDVGQGDALVLRSAGRVALVDSGPEPEPLARCLDELGVASIDLLVLTHFDLDHRGGLASVRGRVGTVLHGPLEGPEDRWVLADLAAAGARIVPAGSGMTGELGNAQWRVLWPRADAAPGNAASVVLELRGGGLPSALLLGDLDADAQRGLRARARPTGPYDVVKVAHHGSADQDAALYGRLRPAVAIVSVGENTYGHPRAETLGVLRSVGARVVRTDRDGLVVLWRDDDDVLRVWRRGASERVGGGD